MGDVAIYLIEMALLFKFSLLGLNILNTLGFYSENGFFYIL